MLKVEEDIKEYLKDKAKDIQDGIRVPLSHIADDLDYSTATVWRAMQKLKGKRIIKIVKSHNKTLPDKIYYVGEESSLIDTINNLIDRTNSIALILHELKEKIQEKEDAIFKLTKDR